MSTVSVTVAVHVPPEQLFTHVATLWESGAGLNGEAAGAHPPSARLGPGFRLPCAGHRWMIGRDTELEIRDFVETEGWRAVSQPDAVLSWTVRIVPLAGGAGLTCSLRYAPRGIIGRLREWLLSRRRRERALQQLVHDWKTGVERQEALRRLRTGLATLEPGQFRRGTG